MKLLTGLFRVAKKRQLTADNDMGQFRSKIDELVEKKDELDEGGIAERVEELKKITEDLPESDDKAKLGRFLEDFKTVKEQDAGAAKEAAKIVADLFEKLDTAAMEEVPAAGSATQEETTETETETETIQEEEPGEAAETETTAEIAEETEAPAEGSEEGKADDADPNPEYTLEEIYQFVKKRMSEDAACEETTDGDEKEEEEEKDDEGAGAVADHAPVIPVTVNNTVKGGLDDLFAAAKGGK